jgi:DNA-binding transcriptional ArsR family regulator
MIMGGMSDSLPDTTADEASGDSRAPTAGKSALPAASALVSARPAGVPAGASVAAKVLTAGTTAVVVGVPAGVAGPGVLEVLKALADPVRLRVVQMMARGEVLTVIGMAKRLKVHPDTMGKHLKVLRRAKLVRKVKTEGADGRTKEFQISAAARAVAGELDFGGVLLRGAALPDVAAKG